MKASAAGGATTVAPVPNPASAAATIEVAGPPARSRRGGPSRALGTRGALGTWGPPAVVFLLFIGVWYLFSYVFLSEPRRFLVPPPHQVIDVGFLDGHNRSELLDGLWVSTKVATIGLLIAIMIGMSSAILMSQAKWLERSLFPYAVILQTVPILALVPLLGLWFSFGFQARVIVCVLIALFPIISNTLFGLQSVDRALHDLFKLNGAGRFTRLWKLQLPAAMPAVFAGFRISAGLAVIGAIVGDFFFKQGDRGLGILIDVYRARNYTDRMFAAIILSSLLGVVVFWLFGALSQLVVGRWYRPQRDTG